METPSSLALAVEALLSQSQEICTPVSSSMPTYPRQPGCEVPEPGRWSWGCLSETGAMGHDAVKQEGNQDSQFRDSTLGTLSPYSDLGTDACIKG